MDVSRLRLAPCVPKPGKVICIGLNYRRHAAESNLPVPERPIVFAKLANTPAACDEDIPLAPISSQYDYEAELVVVIGRKADACELPKVDGVMTIFFDTERWQVVVPAAESRG